MANLGADGTGWFNAPYEWVHHVEHGIAEQPRCLGRFAGLELQYAVFCGDWLFGGLGCCGCAAPYSHQESAC